MPPPLRPRGSLHYDKPPMSVDELVGRLADRGLEIPDPPRAARYLRHIGYYRLSPYTIPFQHGRPDHLLRTETGFDDVLDLYVFDRALRLLIMDGLERVEVAVRAALTDHMSTTYDNPHWYMDTSHFRDRGRHSGLLTKIRNTCEARLRGTPDAEEDSLVHRSALEHYLTTYGSPELPPSWLMVETLTIGQLSGTFRNLRRRSDKTAVAKNIRLTAPVLESWMQTYARVQHLRAPRASVERRARRVSGNPDFSHDLLAERHGRATGAIQEAPLSRVGLTTVRSRLGVTAQHLGNAPS